MSFLKVVKASAGSGKTFRLTIEYIKLLLQYPYAHRNILAVSFTNKATAEMKDRILGELYGMAVGCEDSEIYLQIISQESNFTPEEIREKAKTALSALLHDYSRFYIETIDSFHQRLLRNLAKEIGLGASFQIELDSDLALREAVSKWVSMLKPKSENLEWICEILAEKEEEQKSGAQWEEEIFQSSRKIFEEPFVRKERQVEAFFSDRKKVKNYILRLRERIKEETLKLEKQVKCFELFMTKRGISLENFKSGGMGNYVRSLLDGKNPSETQIGNIENEKWEWFKKSDPLTNAPFIEELNALVIETEKIRKECSRNKASAELILIRMRYMALLREIALELKKDNDKKNRFLLVQTAPLLAGMIDQNDVSFIHEKIGASLSHILMDEFQDTSDLQWINFKRMLEENLSQGKANLLVGDVKQSIYRWRNSNWETLHQIEGEFIFGAVQSERLQCNYRTDLEIVEFNNALFEKVAQGENSYLAQKFHSEFGKEGQGVNFEKIKTAYQDVKQSAKTNKKQGFVELQFVEKDKEEDRMAALLIEKILTLKQAGIPAQEIMILTRWNKQISRFSSALEGYKKQYPNWSQEEKAYFTVVSDEAFSLGGSTAVIMLIQALRCISGDYPVAEAELAFLYQSEIQNLEEQKENIFSNPNYFLPKKYTENKKMLISVPLYELFEKLIRIFDLQKDSSQHAYLYYFLDCVSEYLSSYTGDINSFLEYWESRLQNKTIALLEHISGLRILSIHKSKGLEFHTVIVPYCDWDLQSYASFKRSHDVWCEPKGEDTLFDEIPLVPISFSSKMKDSYFAHEYQNEAVREWIDNLNLLYVALTRPKHNLILLSHRNEKDDCKTVSDLLYAFAKQLGIGEIAEDIYQFGALYFQKDQEKHSENKLKSIGENIIPSFSSADRHARYHLSRDASEYFGISLPNIFLSKGEQYHKLLEYITTFQDISSAMDRMIAEGYMRNEERVEYERWIKKAFSDARVQDWFSGKYILFNERSIVFENQVGELQIQRPDRVMLKEDGALILLDYKTGKKYEKYKKQLEGYQELLLSMGYPKVEAFVWYLDLFEIEAI